MKNVLHALCLLLKSTTIVVFRQEVPLHWTLDVAFSEDASRKRNKNAAQNFSIILKIALNLLKNEKSDRQGIAGKRLRAGWDENYRMKVLNIKV